MEKIGRRERDEKEGRKILQVVKKGWRREEAKESEIKGRKKNRGK